MIKNIIIGVCVLMIGVLSLLVLKKSTVSDESLRKVPVASEKERKAKQSAHLYESALTYQQAGEHKEALRVWKEILEATPADQTAARAAFELGRHAESEGKLIRADQYYDRLVNDHPSSEYVPQALYSKARRFEQAGHWDQAQKLYRQILNDHFYWDRVKEAQSRLENLNLKTLFSRQLDDKSQFYEVRGGDSLYTIARKFGTTIEYLMEANGLAEKAVIHPGDRLKVLKPTTRFQVNVDKSQRSLLLMVNGEVLKSYSVAIGKENATPVGEFKVENKLKDPVWFKSGAAIPPDDPRNILGSRWIGFFKDIGIHGTTEQKDILDQTSNGCVRMYNHDIEELYKVLSPGDLVLITE